MHPSPTLPIAPSVPVAQPAFHPASGFDLLGASDDTLNSAFFHEPSDSGFTDDVDDVQIHVVEENGHTVAWLEERLVTVTTDSGEVDVVVFEPHCRLRAGVAFQLADILARRQLARWAAGVRWVAIRTTWTEAHDWAHAVAPGSFFGVSQAHQNLRMRILTSLHATAYDLTGELIVGRLTGMAAIGSWIRAAEVPSLAARVEHPSNPPSDRDLWVQAAARGALYPFYY